MEGRRLFCTGDIHGEFNRIKQIKRFCEENNTTRKDNMIILGDLGANYFFNERDKQFKELMASCPITFLCIHGNHEERPQNISTYNYKVTKQYGGIWYEYEYPNILFLEDGEHIINGKRFLVASGAYSVDKKYRLTKGMKWFESEQMDHATKLKIMQIVEENNQFDYILSHTAPLNYEPKYLFLSIIDQSTVDKSTESFLQWIWDNIDKENLKLWGCGHYHSDAWLSEKIRLFYNDIVELYRVKYK